MHLDVVLLLWQKGFKLFLCFVSNFQSNAKCLADLCGALHCDFLLNPKSFKTKCNPAAVAKNRHLCEVGSTSLIFT